MKIINSVNGVFFVTTLTLASLTGCSTQKGGSDPGNKPGAGILGGDGASSIAGKLGGDVGAGSAAGSNAEPISVGKFVEPKGLQLAFPTRIVAAGELVFVSDAKANQVLGMPAIGEAAQVAITGLNQPLGIAVSGDLLYVGNVGRQDVEVYSLSQHKYLRSLGGVGAFAMPNSIAAASDGTVYVADSKRDVVRVFSAKGDALYSIGSTGSAEGQFNFPAAVAVDDHRVVVGDQANHRVQIFDRSGTFINTFGSEIATSLSRDDYKGKFTRIAAVALQGEDIYVLDSAHSYVQVLDNAGTSKGFMGNAGDCASCFALGLDVAVAGKGAVYVTDPTNSRWVAISTELR